MLNVLSAVIITCLVMTPGIAPVCPESVQIPASYDSLDTGVATSGDGVAIHYTVLGEGEPALVFVHGWCCDSGYWKEQVPHFSQQYMVVTVDLGGHGESGMNREEWTVPAFGADVAAVVDKQIGPLGHRQPRQERRVAEVGRQPLLEPADVVMPAGQHHLHVQVGQRPAARRQDHLRIGPRAHRAVAGIAAVVADDADLTDR